jgi:hypothetical protein
VSSSSLSSSHGDVAEHPYQTSTSSAAADASGLVKREEAKLDGLTRSPLKKRDIKTVQAEKDSGTNNRTTIAVTRATATDGAARKRRKGERPSDAPSSNTVPDELEKKRMASRSSSRRTREREKMKLEYYETMQTKLEGENDYLRSENDHIRQLISMSRKELTVCSSLPARQVATSVVAAASPDTVITAQAPKAFHQAFVQQPSGNPSSLSVPPFAAASVLPSTKTLSAVESITSPTTVPWSVLSSLGAGQPLQPQQCPSNQGLLDIDLLRRLLTIGGSDPGINGGARSSNPVAQLLSALQSQAIENHRGKQHQQPGTDALFQQLVELISTQRQMNDQPPFDGGDSSKSKTGAEYVSSNDEKLPSMAFSALLDHKQQAPSSQLNQLAAMMAAAQGGLSQSLMLQSHQASASPQRQSAVGTQQEPISHQLRHQQDDQQHHTLPLQQLLQLSSLSSSSETPSLHQMQQQLLHLHEQIEKKQLQILRDDFHYSKHLLMQQHHLQHPEIGATSMHEPQQQQQLWLPALTESLGTTNSPLSSNHNSDDSASKAQSLLLQPQQLLTPQQIHQHHLLLKQHLAAMMTSQGSGT